MCVCVCACVRRVDLFIAARLAITRARAPPGSGGGLRLQYICVCVLYAASTNIRFGFEQRDTSAHACSDDCTERTPTQGVPLGWSVPRNCAADGDSFTKEANSHRQLPQTGACRSELSRGFELLTTAVPRLHDLLRMATVPAMLYRALRRAAVVYDRQPALKVLLCAALPHARAGDAAPEAGAACVTPAAAAAGVAARRHAAAFLGGFEVYHPARSVGDYMRAAFRDPGAGAGAGDIDAGFVCVARGIPCLWRGHVWCVWRRRFLRLMNEVLARAAEYGGVGDVPIGSIGGFDGRRGDRALRPLRV